MLRIERPYSKHEEDVQARDGAAGGFLLLGILAASWAVALGLGWVVWRLGPF